MFWFPSKKNDPGLILLTRYFFMDIIATAVQSRGLTLESRIQQLRPRLLNGEAQNFNVNAC